MPLQNQPFMQPMDAAGRPYPEAKAYYYVHGTTTPAAVYANPELTTAHARPVRADAAGKFPQIFTDPAVIYRLELQTAIGTPIAQVDPIGGGFVIGTGDLVNGAVTADKLAARAVGNGKLDLMPAKRVKANLTGVLAAPADVTMAELYAALDVVMRPSRIGKLCFAAYGAEDDAYALVCNGRSLPISDHPDLADVIRPVYGGADADHFYLPDFRGYAPVGANPAGGLTRTVDHTSATLHDALAVGAAHLDQVQGFKSRVPMYNGGGGSSALPIFTDRSASPAYVDVAPADDGTNGTPRMGRTTHGREIGVVIMIYR